MRQKISKIFILIILLSLTCMGGCYPYSSPVSRPQKEGEGLHTEGLLLAQSHIPKKVGFYLSGQYLPNSKATQQLKSGLVRLGFNLVEGQKIHEVVGYLRPPPFEFPLLLTEEDKRRLSQEFGLEAVLRVHCSIKFIPATPYPYRQRKEYNVDVKLINFQEEHVIWAGSFHCYSFGKATDQVLKLLENDIKLFNTKLEGSGLK